MNILLRLMQDSNHTSLTIRDCEHIMDRLAQLKGEGHHVTVGFENLRGGSSVGALNLCNVIWELGFDTHAFTECYSAACIAFSGGVTRTASPSANFMLHEAANISNGSKSRCEIQTDFSSRRFVQVFGWDTKDVERYFGPDEVYFDRDTAFGLSLVNRLERKDYERIDKFFY